MALLVDAGALNAQADRADPHHQAVVQILRAERGALVTSQKSQRPAAYRDPPALRCALSGVGERGGFNRSRGRRAW